MEIKELKEDMNERFDKLEAKLDRFAENALKNEADIKWVKGFVKWSLSGLVSIIIALLSFFIPGSK